MYLVIWWNFIFLLQFIMSLHNGTKIAIIFNLFIMNLMWKFVESFKSFLYPECAYKSTRTITIITTVIVPALVELLYLVREPFSSTNEFTIWNRKSRDDHWNPSQKDDAQAKLKTKQRPKTKDTNEEVKGEVNKEIYQIYKQSAPSWE